MDSVFGSIRGAQGEEYAGIFIDDVALSTEGFEDDSDDDIVNRHIDHCIKFLEKAKEHGVQFKLDKCRWAQSTISLIGFVLGNGVRMPDPAKAHAMREWPAPTSLDDLVSFRAFANFVKEFIPDNHEHERHIHPFLKKGANFSDYLACPEAIKAFENLKHAICEDVMLHTPDYEAAADPNSGSPFELCIDTSRLRMGRSVGTESSGSWCSPPHCSVLPLTHGDRTSLEHFWASTIWPSRRTRRCRALHQRVQSRGPQLPQK